MQLEVGPYVKITHSTSGTIQISYSHIRQEELTTSDVFYTRQVLYPVLVTVYNTLECHGLDILPFASVTAAQESQNAGSALAVEREGWKRTLEGVGDEDGDWCLVTVDVRNTYGIPFEVTFERDQEGQYLHIRRLNNLFSSTFRDSSGYDNPSGGTGIHCAVVRFLMHLRHFLNHILPQHHPPSQAIPPPRIADICTHSNFI